MVGWESRGACEDNLGVGISLHLFYPFNIQVFFGNFFIHL